MKLPNGYGTVYKLPGNRRKPWIARVTVGFEPTISKKTGKAYMKQLYQTIGYFETKKEGLDALAKHRFEPLAPKANILTLENVYTDWSKTAFKEISQQLEDNHKASWNYIKRYAKIPFNDLRTKHFQNVIDECKAANKSESTCKKIRTLISQLYKYAIANDICKTNYAKYIKIGKFEKK